MRGLLPCPPLPWAVVNIEIDDVDDRNVASLDRKPLHG